jgi:hypothetical protein
MVETLSLVYGYEYFNGMEDFGTAVKISEMTNTVDDQQPFQHLTWSKQFVNWFQLIVEWLFG